MVSRRSLVICDARLPLGPAPRFARRRAQAHQGCVAQPDHLWAWEHCEQVLSLAPFGVELAVTDVV